MCSGVKKDAECGFWLETKAAREIFSNSVILGFRTTFQFYEGRAPHGQKTDWVMQEYTITEKCNNNTKVSTLFVWPRDRSRSGLGYTCAILKLLFVSLCIINIKNIKILEMVKSICIMFLFVYIEVQCELNG